MDGRGSVVPKHWSDPVAGRGLEVGTTTPHYTWLYHLHIYRANPRPVALAELRGLSILIPYPSSPRLTGPYYSGGRVGARSTVERKILGPFHSLQGSNFLQHQVTTSEAEMEEIEHGIKKQLAFLFSFFDRGGGESGQTTSNFLIEQIRKDHYLKNVPNQPAPSFVSRVLKLIRTCPERAPIRGQDGSLSESYDGNYPAVRLTNFTLPLWGLAPAGSDHLTYTVYEGRGWLVRNVFNMIFSRIVRVRNASLFCPLSPSPSIKKRKKEGELASYSVVRSLHLCFARCHLCEKGFGTL